MAMRRRVLILWVLWAAAGRIHPHHATAVGRDPVAAVARFEQAVDRRIRQALVDTVGDEAHAIEAAQTIPSRPRSVTAWEQPSPRRWRSPACRSGPWRIPRSSSATGRSSASATRSTSTSSACPPPRSADTRSTLPFGPTTGFHYFPGATNITLASGDTVTLTALSQTSGATFSAALTPTAVLEPATLTLMIAGLAALPLRRRLRW